MFRDPMQCSASKTISGEHNPFKKRGRVCDWCGQRIPLLRPEPNPLTETDYEARARQLEEGQ